MGLEGNHSSSSPEHQLEPLSSPTNGVPFRYPAPKKGIPGWAWALLIAGLLVIAVMVLGVLGTFGFVLLLDKPDVARWHKAEAQLREIEKALDIYYLTGDAGYPQGLSELEPRFFPNGVPVNPYTRRPYDYERFGFGPDSGYRLTFLGKDGVVGGVGPPDEDIVIQTHANLPAPRDGERRFR